MHAHDQAMPLWGLYMSAKCVEMLRAAQSKIIKTLFTT